MNSYEKMLNEDVKQKDMVVQQPNVSIKRSYTQALFDLPIADAAKMPSFSAVRDSGYRCGIFSPNSISIDKSSPSSPDGRFLKVFQVFFFFYITVIFIILRDVVFREK